MILSEEEKDNLYYLCSVVESLGRITNNKRDYVVKKLGRKNIEYIYTNAQVLHCEPIKLVCEQIISDCNIENGLYQTQEQCTGKPPRTLAIGKLYSRLIIALLQENDNIIDKTIEVLSSWLVLKITNFDSSLYYSVVEYLKECYIEGKILEY